MNKLKRVVAAIMAAATVSALSVSAFAINYNHYAFNLSPASGSYKFSSASEKQDNEDYAQALCKGGSVTNTRFLVLSVYKSASYYTSNCISDPVTVYDANNVNYRLNYTVDRGAGSTNYLCAAAGYYSAQVNGNWDP